MWVFFITKSSQFGLTKGTEKLNKKQNINPALLIDTTGESISLCISYIVSHPLPQINIINN